MAHDVFVSYASGDKTVADAVCATLESHGIRVWIAPRDVLPGIHYGEAIIDAIHECRIMVLVFSSKANLSGHIPKEIERAVSQGITVMPLRIEDVAPAKSLDYFIGSVHWLDALTPAAGSPSSEAGRECADAAFAKRRENRSACRSGACSRERASHACSGARHAACGAAHVGIFRDRRLGRSRSDSRLPDVPFQVPAEHGDGNHGNRSV